MLTLPGPRKDDAKRLIAPPARSGVGGEIRYGRQWSAEEWKACFRHCGKKQLVGGCRRLK